jgi:hypothetical protein
MNLPTARFTRKGAKPSRTDVYSHATRRPYRTLSDTSSRLSAFPRSIYSGFGSLVITVAVRIVQDSKRYCGLWTRAELSLLLWEPVMEERKQTAAFGQVVLAAFCPFTAILCLQPFSLEH